MSKIIIHKELSIRSGTAWDYLGRIELDNKNELWAKMHSLGDTFRRGYSAITNMFLKLEEPYCAPHHLDHNALCKLREQIGHTNFDRMFGYFPFDDITVFTDAESRNELISDFSIYNARVIAYEVK